MDAETGQTILSGMGELHLEILVDRLKREFGVSVNTGQPQVSYREQLLVSARGSFDTASVQVVNTSGGASGAQSVVVEVEVTPLASNGTNMIYCGSPNTKLPKEPIISAARAAASEALDVGPILGFPILGLNLNISQLNVVGSLDEVGPMIRSAVIQAIRSTFVHAKASLLEPICTLEVFVPDAFLGVVVSDINSRRGKVLRIDMNPTQAHQQAIKAEVPLAMTFGYATELRSLTQGRASFHLKVTRYESVPSRAIEEILRKYGRS